METRKTTSQLNRGTSDGRISRVTLPTASFSLTTYLIAWIEEEARRRGVKKSVLVREILTAEMEKQEASAA